MLGRIRGLLAKAERTEFAEEAEAFTAKAQELMSRYAITAALLRSHAHAGGTVVHSRRFHFENPYLKEKVHLLTAIGDANRVRTVLFGDLDIATAVGTPVDLQQVDLLFTSLLVQSARALQSGAAEGRSGARTTGFRKAFLAGFASRIGQRLRDADARATEAAAAEESIPLGDLLPVLATTSAAVDAEFTRLFPAPRLPGPGRWTPEVGTPGGPRRTTRRWPRVSAPSDASSTEPALDLQREHMSDPRCTLSP
ncbi:DUF2786 domain-containing protein [Rhodococcus sp. MTM3W5.2]|uniref:DUF2786 domain-containing protein n=1 Tax=Rhodococcus sp. MTM3W5.2 TaxID=1805827 RepID=UPI001CB980B5|nr:DUF2786 domain-containing protein [Rhodococcus sp. MTM3W5.2]